jgi:uncharacterized protein
VIIVADTTPLSELAKVGHLNLIQDVFGEIVIPQEVYREVTTGDHPAVAIVKLATWIEVRSISDVQKLSILQRSTNLDLGECAAIVLTEEIGADQILLDDLDARRIAKARNLSVIGTIGTLILAKQRGVIVSVRVILDNLIEEGAYISQRVYRDALVVAGESSNS